VLHLVGILFPHTSIISIIIIHFPYFIGVGWFSKVGGPH